jgi:poly(glycerol-phosphate) alpha-glucosyltransferase
MIGARIGLLSAWLSRRNGGVWEAVATHAAILRAQGLTPVVIGLDHADHVADRIRLDGVEVIACPIRGPERLGYAPALERELADAALDLLHLHGLWTYPSRAGAAWARAGGGPYLVSPHGMLDPWILARGRTRKAVARPLLERPNWAAARLFHALTQAEAADIARATGRREIAVIPNAVAPAPPASDGRPPVLLYLGRLHPKKNLVALVEGWAGAVPDLPPGARLDIVGWGEPGHRAAVERAVARHPRANVRLVGPLFGAAKQAALAEARFLALPSLGEGLPMAVLEGWAAGTPALLSNGCHLPEGFIAGAALPCGTEPAGIATAISAAFARPEEAWQPLSAAARRLATERFSPAVVGARWADLYAGLLGDRRRAAA